MEFNELVRPVLIPSGAFVYHTPLEYGAPAELVRRTGRGGTPAIPEEHQSLDYGRSLFNPLVLEKVSSSEMTIDADEAEALLRASEKDSTLVLRADAVDGYADRLVDIAKELTDAEPSFVLIPLRGAFRPAVQLRVLTGFDKLAFLPVPFTRGSLGDADDEVRALLTKYLPETADKDGVVQFSVFDTAIGGHSVVRLSNLVADVSSELDLASVETTFHLLHPAARRPPQLGALVQERGKYKGSVSLHGVDDLLIEDHDAAIGLEIDTEGGSLIVKPSVREGRLLLFDPTGRTVQAVETPDLANYFDAAVAEVVDLSLRTDSEIGSFRGDVWQDYAAR